MTREQARMLLRELMLRIDYDTYKEWFVFHPRGESEDPEGLEETLCEYETIIIDFLSGGVTND